MDWPEFLEVTDLQLQQKLQYQDLDFQIHRQDLDSCIDKPTSKDSKRRLENKKLDLIITIKKALYPFQPFEPSQLCTLIDD